MMLILSKCWHRVLMEATCFMCLHWGPGWECLPPVRGADVTADLRGQSWEVGSNDWDSAVKERNDKCRGRGAAAAGGVKVAGLENESLDLMSGWK